jgi:phosphatidylglycerophosphate synthase
MPGTDQVTRPVARRITPERPADAEPVTMSYREALHTLKSRQKSGKGAPAYSRFVNRRLGRYLAAAAYQAGLTPNAVTALSGLCSFAAIALLALLPPSIPLAIAVTGGLVLGYALDSADGQLARLRGGGSPSGEWLDHMIDAGKISSLHLAVLIFLFRAAELPGQAWLLVPIGFTVVAAVAFFGMILNDQLRRVSGLASGQDATANPGRSASTLRSLLVIPTDYGVLCLIFLLLAWPNAFFVGYALLFAGSAGYLLLACVKWFRDMRALDRAAVPASPVSTIAPTTTAAPTSSPTSAGPTASTPAGPERTSR